MNTQTGLHIIQREVRGRTKIEVYTQEELKAQTFLNKVQNLIDQI